MKIDFSKTKLFTIFLTLFYCIGLFGVFYNHEIVCSIVTFSILLILTFFSNLSLKRIIILYLIFFLGILRAHNSIAIDDFIKDINYNDAAIHGKIITSSDINSKKQKIKFYILADKISAYNKSFDCKNKILVNFDLKPNLKEKIKIGNYIEVRGKLRTPKPSTNPYQFDYKKYLLNNDCAHILYADNLINKGEVRISKNLEDDWYYILRQFEIVRENIILKHSKNIKSPRLEVLGGIVFGNETINPDEEIKENFKNSGLLHLLAASGLNVALIYGIWYWIASLIRLPFNFSIGLGAIFIVLYTFMTGFPPSILRASLMLLFVLFGKLIDRKSDSVALIFFVGFLILLFSPKMIFDIGFQLSFVVTLGLISCCEVVIRKFDEIDNRFKERFKNSPRYLKYFIFLFSPCSLIGVIVVPLIAQIWVIPLQMHYFNNFAPYSILANICVVPFIGILSFIGFISSIFALIPYLNDFVVYLFDLIANPMLALLIKISEIFSSFKYSLISTISLNIFQMFDYWAIVFIFILNLKNNFKNKKQVILLSILILFFTLSFIKPINKNLEVIMFDVENADCFLVKTPKNKYILIDTGRKTYRGISSGAAVVNKYLKNERISELELIIITHFDIDHSGGALDILENTKVNKVILQKENETRETAKEIYDFIKENNIDYEIAKNNEIVYKEDNLTLKTYKSNIDDDNENSIVELLNYKDKNILFMADVGLKGYSVLKNNFSTIDILKVGHHGAQNVIDSKMLDDLKPKYALISTGVNKYGHPHYSTIKLLEDKKIPLILTKHYGFVKIIADDKINFLHFDKNSKTVKPLNFMEFDNLPFHKSKYVQEFIRLNQ